MTKCSPNQIIKDVPNVQSVILAADWFDYLDYNSPTSIFATLYQWMVDHGGVPQANITMLPTRTYVGEKLYNRLLDAERKRIAKRAKKLKREELDEAVSWSDAMSGPKNLISGFPISGDTLLVVPEESRHALAEFSSRLMKQDRDLSIAKIKKNAAGATFYQWLASQIERPDRVGDSARDAMADSNYPRESNMYGEINAYLLSQGASHRAIESLNEGWLEYLQQYPNRIKPKSWCSECGQAIDVDNAIFCWSTESGDIYVLDGVCFEKYTQFDELKSLALKDITGKTIESLGDDEDISKYDLEEIVQKLKLWGVLPLVEGEGNVYFIRSEKTHAIKIGFTAGNVEDRMSALQTAHPYKLTVLATLRGGMSYEKELHKRFGRFRLEGEWFEPHPDLLAFIAVLPSP